MCREVERRGDLGQETIWRTPRGFDGTGGVHDLPGQEHTGKEAVSPEPDAEEAAADEADKGQEPGGGVACPEGV